MALLAQGDVSAMDTFMGGVVCQEVMKACSGKFNPIYQVASALQVLLKTNTVVAI